MSAILLIAAIIVEALILIALVASLALPRTEAWQAGAFLLFFCSFLPLESWMSRR